MQRLSIFLRALQVLELLRDKEHTRMPKFFPESVIPESAGAGMRSDALMKETLPFPETKLSSAIDEPPPPHDESRTAITGKRIKFFIFISLGAIDD
jgi:hypothetical protein